MLDGLVSTHLFSLAIHFNQVELFSKISLTRGSQAPDLTHNY